MGNEPVLIRVSYPKIGSEYRDKNWNKHHQWIMTQQRVRANRKGERDSQMHDTNWTVWVCVNPTCPAQAIVHDDAVRALIHAATPTAAADSNG